MRPGYCRPVEGFILMIYWVVLVSDVIFQSRSTVHCPLTVWAPKTNCPISTVTPTQCKTHLRMRFLEEIVNTLSIIGKLHCLFLLYYSCFMNGNTLIIFSVGYFCHNRPDQTRGWTGDQGKPSPPPCDLP